MNNGAIAPPTADPREEATLRIHLLGGFRVVAGGRTLTEMAWRLRKARSLVKLLALHAGRWVAREQVMDLLWPDLDPAAADNNLRGALHIARRALAPHGAIIGRDGALALRAEGTLWLDSVAYETAAAAARHSREPVDYTTALDRYTGDLLPEDRYEDWTIGVRDRLRDSYLTLLLEVAALYEARGEWPAAIVAFQRVLGAEAAHEAAHVGLMRLYALAGQRARALNQWDQLVAALRRDLDAAPDPATRRLRAAIADGSFPPVGAPSADRGSQRTGSLPLPLTALIGREDDLGAVKAALGRSRLLVLTGAGGCGKTRLALAAATDLAAVYPDGVWFIDLAPLADPALVPGAVAATFGIREEPGRPLLATVHEALADRAALLLLDNCEHVRNACAEFVAAILARCPGIRVLATSRATLGVPGEIIWRVPSLRVPPAIPQRPIGEIAAAPAVRLFVERIRQRQPAFDLTPEHSAAVAEIVRRLDGIPLALELAAARATILPVGAVAALLDDALPLLTGGSRTAAPRQQTLRATLDWSYALLAPPHRAILRRLSVFAGGATLAAIEAVCTETGPVARIAILDGLGELTDHSLVQADPLAGRYSLLETVRQFAAEQLAAMGEAEPSAARHFAHYLALAEEAAGGLNGPDQGDWLARLDRDHDNLRAALAWAASGDDAIALLRLSGALGRFWFSRGHLREGRRWLEAALARSTTAPAALRAKALHEAGAIISYQADYPHARRILTESLALARAAADAPGTALALNQLASVALMDNDPAAAEALYTESLILRRRADDRRGVAASLLNLGNVALVRGDATGAEALLAESLATYREIGHLRGIAFALNNGGWVALLRADPQQAQAAFAESLPLLHELGDTYSIAECLTGLASALAARGLAREAARLGGAAEGLRAVMGAPLLPFYRTLHEEALASARAGVNAADWDAAWAAGQRLTLDDALAETRALTAPHGD